MFSVKEIVQRKRISIILTRGSKWKQYNTSVLSLYYIYVYISIIIQRKRNERQRVSVASIIIISIKYYIMLLKINRGEWIKRRRGDDSRSASPNKRFFRLKFSKFLILKIRGKTASRILFLYSPCSSTRHFKL